MIRVTMSASRAAPSAIVFQTTPSVEKAPKLKGRVYRVKRLPSDYSKL
jgi:hypothetical protein